jgi:hypothetical protein
VDPHPPSLASQFAGIIPSPETVRADLERVNTEANLLRRLLRLALRREREAERLAEATRQGVA